MKYYSFLLLFLFFFCTEKNINSSVNNILLDSIKKPKNVVFSDSCLKKTDGFFKRFGLVISNFYAVRQAKPIDINHDNIMDTVAILKPFYASLNQYECPIPDKVDDNILVISTTINHKSVFVKKYNKVISVKDELLGIEEIEPMKTGFVISGDWGHSNTLLTNIYVSYKKNNFYIDSLRLESSGINQYDKIYKYRDLSYPLSAYKREVIDSLETINDKSN